MGWQGTTKLPSGNLTAGWLEKLKFAELPLENGHAPASELLYYRSIILSEKQTIF